jgi:integrase
MVANVTAARSAPFTMNTLERIAAPESGLRWVRDPRMPGLFVVASPTGRKWWYVYKKVNGKPRKIKLADFEALSIDKARGRAAEVLAEFSRGVDVSVERRRERARLREESTFGEVFAVYLEEWAKPFKRSWRDDERRYKAHLEKWAHLRLGEMLRQDVQSLYNRIAAKHTHEPKRVIMLVSRIFSFAEKNVVGWDGKNPVRGIETFKEQSRSRFLSLPELRSLLQAIDASGNEAVRDVIRLLVLTGQREGNVLAMRWSEIDFATGMWTIPSGKFKGKREHRVHMPDDAIAILRRRHDSKARHPLYVFPGRVRESGGAVIHEPLKEIKSHWQAIKKAAGLKDVRIHDIRRTWATWALANGTSIYTVKNVLGHRDIATTEIYARLQSDGLRDAMNTTGRLLLRAAMPEPASSSKRSKRSTK